eukprot:7971788-Alexandrium_andersonii.AAC.1
MGNQPAEVPGGDGASCSVVSMPTCSQRARSAAAGGGRPSRRSRAAVQSIRASGAAGRFH